jgi:hypothetical protein
MPRWEEIVQWVVVESNYVRVEESADSWTRAFRRIDELKTELNRLHDSIAWRGRAANAFRGYLKELVTALEKTAEEHRSISDGMRVSAAALKEAVHSIPIPEAMYDRVIAMREAYHTNVSPPGLTPGIFYPAVSSVAGTDWAVRVEAWFTENEKKAQDAYNKLVRAYEGTKLPEGSTVTPPDPKAPVNASGAGTRTAPKTATGQTNPLLAQTNPLATQTNPFASLNQPPVTSPTGAVPPLASLPPLDTSTDTGDLDTDPSSTDPVLAGLDPLELEPSTGLAGVDGSGFGGAGGVGGGGIGAGKLPGIGPSVAMPAASVVAAGGQPGALPQQLAGLPQGSSAASGGTMVGAGAAGGSAPPDGAGAQAVMSKLFDEDPRRTYGLRDADNLPDGTVT